VERGILVLSRHPVGLPERMLIFFTQESLQGVLRD